MNKQFEEWLDSKSIFIEDVTTIIADWEDEVEIFISLDTFNKFPFSMQWGVYLEFFDSVGIVISLGKLTINYSWSIKVNDDFVTSEQFNTRQEAQQEAIKKAFSLLESK